MNKLEKQVMAGVAAIYVARRLTSPGAVKTYALLLSLVGIAAFVSLPHVAANFIHAESSGVPALVAFLLSAVTKTNFVVQAALVVGTVALLSLARDMVRSPVSQRSFA